MRVLLFKSNIKSLMLSIAMVVIVSGCKKIIVVEPPTTFVTGESAFSSNQSAIAELNGLYFEISMGNAARGSVLGSVLSLSTGPSLSSDEFEILPPGGFSHAYHQAIYRNEISSAVMSSDLWSTCYKHIFKVNTIIEGLDKAVASDQEAKSLLSPAVKKQLLGEAKLMRAFLYFYMVNCFGDVPLITTTDYRINNMMPRTSADIVYKQMEADLLEAERLLGDNYVGQDAMGSTTERTRPVKWAAKALLARVYLYMGRYAQAEAQSTDVIDKTSLYSLTTLDGVFLKNSKETIFALQPVIVGYHSSFGRSYVLPVSGPTSDGENYPVFLNRKLVDSFDPGDPRLANWIKSVTVSGTTYYYPFKYKKGDVYDAAITPATKTQNILEYNMVLRLAELYLIRAEAKARRNDLTGAIEDINAIRKRARNNVSVTPVDLPQTLGQSQLLDAIGDERHHELFTEWGDRWFDLRRTGRLNGVMTIITPLKSGKDWEPYQAYYPIPLSIIRGNPNLRQNEGYLN